MARNNLRGLIRQARKTPNRKFLLNSDMEPPDILSCNTPDSAQALFERAIQAIRDARPLDAVGWFNRLLEKYPDHLDGWGHLANLYVHLRQFDRAAECYEEAIGLAPHLTEAYWRLADCYYLLEERACTRRTLRRLKGAPEYASEEIQRRLLRGGIITRRSLRNGIRLAPRLLARLCRPRLLRALLREIVLVPGSWRGIGNAGLYSFLCYLYRGLVEDDGCRFPPVPCDLCGSSSSRAVFFHENHKIVRCTVCGLECVERRPPAGRDAFTGFYERDDVIAGERSVWRNLELVEERVRRLGSMLEKNGRRFPEPGASVFEIGCGEGQVLHVLKKAGMKVSGVDVSRKLVDHARNQLGLEVSRCSVSEIDTTTGPFDYVLSYHVIEHLDRPSDLLAKAHDVLTTDGYFLLETPVPDLENASFMDRHHTTLGYASPEHMHFFTDRTVVAYLTRHGFEVVDNYHFNVDNLPIGGFLARKLERPKGASCVLSTN